MQSGADPLLKVLQIGHATSCRGKGLSLKDAIASAHYRELRPRFEPDDLVPLIVANPELIEVWLRFSEDKRTGGGFYLVESGVIGSVETGAKLRFEPIQRAVAEYVVRELDFWAGINAS